MTLNQLCPGPDAWRQLVEANTPERPDLLAHLERCEQCQRTVEEVAGAATSWDDLRSQLGPARDAPPDGPALRRVVEELTDAPELAGTSGEAAADSREGLPMAQAPPESLRRLDHYDILEPVGRGGMGEVFKALDTKLQRLVAIKVLAPHLAASTAACKRFVREAQSAANVRDDHVVAIHAIADDGPVPYLVMEYILGRTLEQRLQEGGPLPPEEVVRVGLQAARGLAAAHARGLVHRDVKPSNILLEDGHGRVKLTDFGLARAADDFTLTRTGEVAGTPLYMSPEQARGEPVDHRSDLFSLGSVLYALCTGRPPFQAANTAALLRRLSEDAPRPVRALNPEVPAWLEAIIVRLHAKDPADRFASAAELAEALAAGPTRPERPERRQPAPRPVPRLRMAFLVALLVATAGLLVWRSLPRSASAPEVSARQKRPTDFGPFLIPAGGKSGWMARSSDGKWLAVPSGSDVVLFDARTREEIRTLAGDRGQVWKVTFHPDATHLAAVSRDAGDVRVWEVGSGRLAHSLAGHDAWVHDVAFSPDGSRLATASMDRDVKVWDWRAARETFSIPCDAAARGVAFSPNGALLAVAASAGDAVRVCDASTGRVLRVLRRGTGWAHTVAFSRDGNRLLATGPPGLEIWDTSGWESVRVFAGVTHEWADFDPDGRTVLSAATDHHNGSAHAVTRWDVGSGREVARRPLKGGGGYAAYALSHDGRTLYAGRMDRTDGVVWAYQTAGEND